MKRLRLLIVKLLQRARLNKLAHRIYYGYVHGFDTANRAVLPALERALARVAEDGTAGDYCEFGIFKGYAFWHAQRAAVGLGLSQLRFFGFDSFAGLPTIEQIDRTDLDVFYRGQYSCSREQVTANLDSKGVDWSRTELIEGYFETSLTPEVKSEHGLDTVAVALIDCDLYSSTVEVLDFLDGILVDGCVLMFDDWNCFDRDDDRGQRRAFREFLGAHPGYAAEEWFEYGVYGQVFILRHQEAA